MKTMEKAKKTYAESEWKEYLDFLIDEMKNLWLYEVTGIMMYKKTDYTRSTKIAEFMDIKDKWNIARLTMARRCIVMDLMKHNVIKNFNVSMDDIFGEKEMIDDKIIVQKEDGTKKFDFNKLNEIETNHLLKNGSLELTTENIQLYVCFKMIQELENFYGEEQLNDDLNKDKSYKQVLFYDADKTLLEKILFNIKKDWKKEIIETYEFKKDNLYINWEVFKIKNSEKTPYFIKMLSLYLSEKQTKKINITDFITFYENTSTKKHNYLKLNLSNIKNTFISTIRKQTWKIYINNEILEIKGNDIVLL